MEKDISKMNEIELQRAAWNLLNRVEGCPPSQMKEVHQLIERRKQLDKAGGIFFKMLEV